LRARGVPFVSVKEDSLRREKLVERDLTATAFTGREVKSSASRADYSTTGTA
jgi:hypothetical protein